MPVECAWYRLDGLDNGVCRFLSDEQRSRMRTRCWAFLDEEDDVVGLVSFTLPWFVYQVRCHQVFSCHKLIVAKISRHDYPALW